MAYLSRIFAAFLAWFSTRPAPPPPPDPLALTLIAALQQQADANARLVEQVLTQSRDQALASQALVADRVDLWKPRRDPQASSMNERMLKKELDEAAWEPIAEDIFARLDADLGVPDDFLRD
jgi:hypothetical protein